MRVGAKASQKRRLSRCKWIQVPVLLPHGDVGRFQGRGVPLSLGYPQPDIERGGGGREARRWWPVEGMTRRSAAGHQRSSRQPVDQAGVEEAECGGVRRWRIRRLRMMAGGDEFVMGLKDLM